MLLPPIFGCSKRHVAIINVVSSCSSLSGKSIFYAPLKDSINKDNKGRFGFLKIDATHAVSCWVRWTTRQMRILRIFRKQIRLSKREPSFRSLVPLIKKMEPTTFSAVSSQPAGWCAKAAFPSPISSLQWAAFYWSILGFDLSSLKWWLCDGGEVSIPCKIAESTVPTNRKENFLHFQELNLDLPKKIVDTLFPLYVINRKSLLRHWWIGSLPAKNH